MTKDNYIELSNSEFLGLILSKTDVPHLVSHLRKNNIGLYLELERRADGLGTSLDKIQISAILYCLKHNLKEIPRCKNDKCTNHVKWNPKKQCFREYCSRTCSGSSPLVKEHREHNYMLNNGVKNPFQYSKVKEKIAQKNIERLGVGNPSQAVQVILKRKNTSLLKRGVECPFQDESVKRKIRETNLERLGVENPSQSKEVRDKQIKSCIKNLGVPYPSQSSTVKQRIVQTNRKRFGCDYYTQSVEYFNNKKHKFNSQKYPGLTFDSKWEVKVYEFCRDNDIQVEYSPKISYQYEYEYDGSSHTYHPDFLINGGVYEVKGDNFFKVDESTNCETMICPYRESEWTDEHYDYMCGLYEAKHQCMLVNNVVILRKAQIDNLSIGLFDGKQSML